VLNYRLRRDADGSAFAVEPRLIFPPDKTRPLVDCLAMCNFIAQKRAIVVRGNDDLLP
jgi:hypothetical protein